MDLPWVKRQIKQKLSFIPYSGTLNIHLTGDIRSVLDQAEGIKITPETGYFVGVLFRAKIGNLETAVVLPKVPGYPSDVLEIIAPVCLRERLSLEDGASVTITVDV